MMCVFAMNRCILSNHNLRWTGNVARMDEYRNAFKFLTGMPIGKRPSGRWEGTIKIGLKE